MRKERAKLFELAEEQHGLIAVRQALPLIGRGTIDQMLASGVLARERPGVLRAAGSAETELQSLLSPVLASGRHAALSHTSALAHWGVRGFVVDPLHVVRRRDVDDHGVSDVTLHEVRFLPHNQVRTLDHVPVVTPSLALLQLAGMSGCSDGKLSRAIDAAWADRLVNYTMLTRIDQTMSRQGRRGLARFREAVEARGPAYVPHGSNLEHRFADLLARNGRRPMKPQVDVSGGDGWIGRVDFLDELLPVIAEIQSARFHRGLTAEADDRLRVSRLRSAGFEVIELTDEDLFFRAAYVLDQVDSARAIARARSA